VGEKKGRWSLCTKEEEDKPKNKNGMHKVMEPIHKTVKLMAKII
jgi:hypothetical protein